MAAACVLLATGTAVSALSATAGGIVTGAALQLAAICLCWTWGVAYERGL